MTPEVLLCKPYTKELDIYSLGVIISKISTGKSLFENESYNIDLQLSICNGLRSGFASETPDCYIQLAIQY